MGNCMKITLHLLALCLLLSITTKVSGKPNPQHLLIETKNKAKNKNSQALSVNNIYGDYQISQTQSNGGGSHNSQTMDNQNIFGGSVSQRQSNGGGSHNSQNMKNSNIHGGSVSQSQSNGGGSHNSQTMDNQNIFGGLVSQSQSNGGGSH